MSVKIFGREEFFLERVMMGDRFGGGWLEDGDEVSEISEVVEEEKFREN